jgi:hypothetical protein
MRAEHYAHRHAVLVRAVLVALVSLLATAGCAATTDGHGRVAAQCAPVFLGVPGSGQGVLNRAPGTVPAGVSAADAARFGSTVGRLKTELVAMAGKGLASAASIDYPAIPVTDYIGIGGLTADLGLSEAKGSTKLVTAIRAARRGQCAGRTVLLSGYSQGAEVVIRAVGRLTPAERAKVSVALFGNPSYQPGQPGDFPGASDAAGIRPAFTRGAAFTLPADVRSRTIDVCAPGDPVCGVDPNLKFLDRISWVIGHAKIHENAYASGGQGLTKRAAQFLWQHRAG